MSITIRRENKKDYRVVEILTREAFWNLYVPGCSEHFVLHNLRQHCDFVSELDFVAEQDGNIVGNIVFSRGFIENSKTKEHRYCVLVPSAYYPIFKTRALEVV